MRKRYFQPAIAMLDFYTYINELLSDLVSRGIVEDDSLTAFLEDEKN